MRTYRSTAPTRLFAAQTCDNADHVPFQSHDFSMRGMSSLESAETSGAGYLTTFLGTDTIPASEHSVMSSHGIDELPTFRYLMARPDNAKVIIRPDNGRFLQNHLWRSECENGTRTQGLD